MYKKRIGFRGNKSKVTEDVSNVHKVPINTVNIESDTSNVNIKSSTAVNIESNNESVNSQYGINLSATSVSSQKVQQVEVSTPKEKDTNHDTVILIPRFCLVLLVCCLVRNVGVQLFR